ncbi:MAG: spore coat protein CotJB [Oscillospiraceae bacterium]|nr:spore coat protein CotJB [Oscillospiraceae bacterium]
MTKRQILLRKISTYGFAILDLQMFLDTHPNDEKTLAKIRKYREILIPLREEYEKEYGPLTKSEQSNNWTWVNSPWPWESEEDE